MSAYVFGVDGAHFAGHLAALDLEVLQQHLLLLDELVQLPAVRVSAPALEDAVVDALDFAPELLLVTDHLRNASILH